MLPFLRYNRPKPLHTRKRISMNSVFKHDLIERNIGLLIVLVILVISVGGLVEIVPLYFQINYWATRKGFAYTARSDERTLAQFLKPAN